MHDGRLISSTCIVFAFFVLLGYPPIPVVAADTAISTTAGPNRTTALTTTRSPAKSGSMTRTVVGFEAPAYLGSASQGSALTDTSSSQRKLLLTTSLQDLSETDSAAGASSAGVRTLDLDTPTLVVAESRATREDAGYGDGYNLGYKPSASESGSYSGWGGQPLYAHSAPSYGQDYGKSDYYNKPSYQPESYGGESYGGGGYDDNRTLLYALAIKLRRLRERNRALESQQNAGGSRIGMMLAGLPFMMSMGSGLTGGSNNNNNGGGLFGNLFGGLGGGFGR